MAKRPARKARAKKPLARKASGAKAAAPRRIKDATPFHDCEDGVITVRRQPKQSARMGVRGVMRVSGWRVALSLNKLLSQLNATAPNRSKASDGAIGDTNHSNRKSDHNPWVIDGGRGVVTARDFTHDAEHGCDCTKLAEAIRASRDPRVKYIIWNRRICTSFPKNGKPAWAWRPYVGRNGHTHHMHLSVKAMKSLYDSQTPWSIG
jgi:hypothetical protein